MQLVVFAVVLILPPFLSGDLSSSITEVSDECEFYIREGGDSFCSNHKSEYKTFDLSACTVICENGDQPEFPKGICSGGKLADAGFRCQGARPVPIVCSRLHIRFPQGRFKAHDRSTRPIQDMQQEWIVR
uniref:Putative secreted protein n=1 Tax=Ixodes ricinus TaxID=34613 RepID=V5HE15_IXORI